ncbi:MAG: hypothetical protein HY698_09405, partial [Deltaproteobacteria bacterium]|nr:hypothetical protein [Deltaproteobacteria bacterium]
MPAPVPKDQTVEGGVQLRITPAGFKKLKDLVPGLINDALSQGFCFGKQSKKILNATVSVCGEKQCAGDQEGCRINIKIENLEMSVPDTQNFKIDATFDVNTTLPVNAEFDWGLLGKTNTGCSFDIGLNNGRAIANINFDIDSATGELKIKLGKVEAVDITGISIDGCGVLGDIL